MALCVSECGCLYLEGLIIEILLYVRIEVSPLNFFLDIVNCESDDGCHANASCTDDNGSYICVCNDGFTGDGFNCTGNKSNILFIPT